MKKQSPTPLADITAGDARLTEAVLVEDTLAPRKDVESAAPAYPTVHHSDARARFAAARPQAALPGSDTPLLQYEGEGLVQRVQIFPWPYSFEFYRRFTDDAIRYARVAGEECPYTYFFSFIPQYHQMTEKQLNYYFYFRRLCREETLAEKTEFSYILLYIYELINLPLPAPQTAQDRLNALTWLYLHYRIPFGELDKYMSEWICDYCLVHQLSMPESLLPLFPQILPRSTMREFYLSALIPRDENGTPVLTPALLIAAGCDYDYTKSRYYPENAEAYDAHIPAAVEFALRQLDAFPQGDALSLLHSDRDAFCGTLCAQTVKRRIHLDYYGFTISKDLSAKITAAVKSAENQLRARLKIKSRLRIDGQQTTVEAVNAYFTRRTRADSIPTPAERAYHHLYEAPSQGMSAADAHRLETASWENTELLTDISEPAPAPIAPAPVEPTEPSDLPNDIASPLRALLAGDAFADIARSAHEKPALLAAKINDYAADRLGDVLLESDGTTWNLIEDYREEVQSWL